MMWQPPVAVLMVFAAGYPVAFVITRRYLLAGVVAPLVTAVTAALAAAGMLLTDGDLVVWLAALLVAQYALATWLLRRRPGRPLPHASLVDVLCLALPLLPPAVLVLSPAVLWDAHSIWWTHAAYFTQGGGFVRQDLVSAAYLRSHPDYPPLASATVAGVWRVLPGYSFTVAQFVSATLTLSAIGTLAYAVRWVTCRAPVAVSRLAGVVVALAAWGTAPFAVAGGYSDQLWAAAAVAGAALLMLGERPLARPALPVLLLVVAVLTKNEALAPVLTVAALATVRHWRDPRRLWPVWLAPLAGVGWVLLARGLGATSDVAASTEPGALARLAGDHAVLDRVPLTLHWLWSMVGLLVVTASTVAVLGRAVLRQERRDLRLGSDLWLWALMAAYTASLVLVYATSTGIDLRWYLSTSLDRVTVPVELLAILSVVCWAAPAIARLREWARRGEPQLSVGPGVPAAVGSTFLTRWR